MKKEDVKQGDFVRLSADQGYSEKQRSVAMQVVEMWDEHMTVKTKNGHLTMPYHHFDKVDDLSGIKSICHAVELNA